MKKQYSRKQIQEAIAYWEKQLRAMNEDAGSGDAGSYVFDEKLERYYGVGNFRAYARSRESGRSELYFRWYQKPKYAGAGRYVERSVFDCARVSHANGGADEWICDIARGKSLADAQRLYEKIRESVEADAPADERDLVKSVRKAVAALGLNTRQSEWYERVGTDHGLDESGDSLSDEEVRDQVERVMEKASDYFGSDDRGRFDRWREDAEKWVEDEIRYGDSSFDELVKGAVAVVTDNT